MQRAQAEADAARIRAEAEAIKREAEAEAARVRADSEAARAAKTKADAEAAAARIRAKAEADAARIRSEAATHPTSAVNTKFDGTWKVTIRCEAHGKATEGFATELVVNVRDGDLYGWRGVVGTPGAMRMEGTIAADGSARLGVRGRTGDPKYEMKGNVPPGSPYRYEVSARFEGSTGTGTRADRPCDIRFARQ